MLTGWDIFWITSLDGLKNLLTLLEILGGIVGGIVHIIIIVNTEEDNEKINRKVPIIIKRYFGLLIISLSLSCLIPSTRTMFAIKILPKIINNKNIEEIPELAIKISKEWLQELIKNKKIGE